LANTLPRRSRPSTKRDRKHLAEINLKLADTSLPEDVRARLEAERDLLAPVVEDGSLNGNEDTFPSVSNPNPRRVGPQDLGSLMEPAVPSLPKFAQRSAGELDRTRASLWPLLSKRSVTPETTAFAIEAVTFSLNLFGKKFSGLSQSQQAGMVNFQFDAWASTQPTAETLAVVAEVHDAAGLK
jgi:hypothetical protein